MRVTDYAGLALIVLLAGTLGVRSCDQRALAAEAEAQRIRADSLAAEAARSRAEADGWSVELGVSDPGAVGQRMAADSGRLAQLASELEAARVRVTSLTRAVSEAQGQIRTVADTVVVTEGSVESFAGRLDDGYLTALWRATVATRSLSIDYQTRDTVVWVTGETGDGRLWVSARPTHPNARFTIDSLFVDLPEPVVVTRTSFWQRAKYVLIGAAGGVVLCAVGC